MLPTQWKYFLSELIGVFALIFRHHRDSCGKSPFKRMLAPATDWVAGA